MSDLFSTLLPAIEQQLQSEDTPFVRATYDRLVADENCDCEEAKHMIALCLADETERMLEDGRPFDLDRYKTLLELLPSLPEGA
mgnify:CR=1 FL=1